MVLLISLIGGRIIPSFTRNWMAKRGRKHGLPTQPGKFDMAVIGVTAVALLAWLSGPAEAPIGVLILLAAVMQAVRLARWSGIRTVADPLVLILHVGYALGAGRAGAAGAQPDEPRPAQCGHSRADRRGDGDDDPRRHDSRQPRPYRARPQGQCRRRHFCMSSSPRVRSCASRPRSG